MAVKLYAEKKPLSHQKNMYELYQHQDPLAFIRELTHKDIQDLHPDVIDACHEIRTSLDILAIQHRWHGYQDLQPQELPDDIDEDTHATKVQMVANELIEHHVPLLKDFSNNKGDAVERLVVAVKISYTKSLTYNALLEGARVLQDHDFDIQAKMIHKFAKIEAKKSGVETEYNFNEAFRHALVSIPNSGKTVTGKAIGPPIPRPDSK